MANLQITSPVGIDMTSPVSTLWAESCQSSSLHETGRFACMIDDGECRVEGAEVTVTVYLLGSLAIKAKVDGFVSTCKVGTKLSSFMDKVSRLYPGLSRKTAERSAGIAFYLEGRKVGPEALIIRGGTLVLMSTSVLVLDRPERVQECCKTGRVSGLHMQVPLS